MTGAFLPPADLEALARCNRRVGADEHLCGKPGVAVADGPGGIRVVLCRSCEVAAIRAVDDPRYAGWRLVLL